MLKAEIPPKMSNRDEAERFVFALYKGMLERNPDAEGFQQHVRALLDSKLPETLVREFLACDEFVILTARRASTSEEARCTKQDGSESALSDYAQKSEAAGEADAPVTDATDDGELEAEQDAAEKHLPAATDNEDATETAEKQT